MFRTVIMRVNLNITARMIPCERAAAVVMETATLRAL